MRGAPGALLSLGGAVKEELVVEGRRETALLAGGVVRGILALLASWTTAGERHYSG